MKEVKRINISQEDMNYLQRLHYEVMARNDVITTLLDGHAKDGDVSILSSPAFKLYSEQLSEFKAELELAKVAIAQKYLPEEYKKSMTAMWEADFSTSELVIKE